MFRMTTLKISLFSAFATLFLLLTMLASTGTASAHTASIQAPDILRPHLLAGTGFPPINGACRETFVKGYGFVPNDTITLTAFGNIDGFNDVNFQVTPGSLTSDSTGSFSADVIICYDGFGSTGTSAWLVATESSDGAFAAVYLH